MEKLAAIRKVEVDANLFLPRKSDVYCQKQLLMSMYQKKQIDQDVYFSAMVKLCGKNAKPFPYQPTDNAS